MQRALVCLIVAGLCFAVCPPGNPAQTTASPGPFAAVTEAVWTRAAGSALQNRLNHAMAFDSARGRTVLFGGLALGGDDSHTWEWNGKAWEDKTPSSASPLPRLDSAMAYDTARGRIVLFGGYNYANGFLNDTWEWDGTTWIDMTPATAPPARYDHAMAYDSARGRVVLFGGMDSPGHRLGDTWEWDGTTWVDMTPGTPGPVPRARHAMAYDSGRGRTVMFGGRDNAGNIRNDTWEWDGTEWASPSMTVNLVPPRESHAMAFDSLRGCAVLFGGSDLNGPLGDTWEWDGTAWLPRGSSASPSVRQDHAMAYDSARGRTVLFGGGTSVYAVGDTWEWDGSDWSLVASPAGPSPRFDHAMAYDSDRGRVVLAGGSNAGLGGNTWEWDGTAWADKTPPGGPPIDCCGALVYDSARKRSVLVGDIFTSLSADTWEWDGTTWVDRTLATGPPWRVYHAMAYDSARGRSVLFGGVGDLDYADTWEWDGATWSDRTPATGPQARLYHAMAYDSARGRVVLFGGYSNAVNDTLGDTWEWDGAAWADKTPAAGGPSARYGHTLDYDSVRGRVVLFGGFTQIGNVTDYPGDTWEWDGATWIETTPVSSPAPRCCAAMAFDTARGRSVLFGGLDIHGLSGDTWEYVGPFQCGPAGASCDDGDACTTDEVCGATDRCTGGLPVDCDDHNACTIDSCDPMTGCVHLPAPGAGPTYVTVRSTQALAGMTVHDGDVLKVDGCSGGISRVVRASAFGGLGVDGLDARSDGTLLFSVRSSGYIRQAGGYLHAREGNVYRLDPASGSIQTVIDWRALGIPIQDLDALDALPDGRIAFSTETHQSVRQAGGWITLRPQNAYAFDPKTHTLSLLFDGARLGLNDIDGIDLRPGGEVAFSTKYDSFAQGVHLKQENAYVVSPAGRIALRFNGRKTGLRTLDDFALGGGN